jgi:hypothetical protein
MRVASRHQGPHAKAAWRRSKHRASAAAGRSLLHSFPSLTNSLLLPASFLLRNALLNRPSCRQRSHPIRTKTNQPQDCYSTCPREEVRSDSIWQNSKVPRSNDCGSRYQTLHIHIGRVIRLHASGRDVSKQPAPSVRDLEATTVIATHGDQLSFQALRKIFCAALPLLFHDEVWMKEGDRVSHYFCGARADLG